MSNLFTTFIKSDRQQQLFNKAEKLANLVKQRVSETEQTATFSKANLQDLKDEGYVSLPLPKEYGGENISSLPSRNWSENPSIVTPNVMKCYYFKKS